MVHPVPNEPPEMRASSARPEMTAEEHWDLLARQSGALKPGERFSPLVSWRRTDGAVSSKEYEREITRNIIAGHYDIADGANERQDGTEGKSTI